MRLIDADALTDEIMERYCQECDNRKGIKNGKYRIIYEVGDAPCRACPMDDMKDELDNAPTIEPERKKGIWKKGIGENGVTASLFCSRCNYENRLWYEWNYCQNCGAKMGEGEQNGQT